MRRLGILVSSALLLVIATPALAIPVTVTSFNWDNNCDTLAVPDNVDELGLAGVFPQDEAISAAEQSVTFDSACASSDSGTTANTELAITNLTSRDFAEVWYVADFKTVISNVDGSVNGRGAFLIDASGVNTPLIAESINPDGIFEVGETWEFIIQDYVNSDGLLADLLASAGLVGTASDSINSSSGSIIGVPVPEPGTFFVLGVGLAGLAVAGRRRSLH